MESLRKQLSDIVTEKALLESNLEWFQGQVDHYIYLKDIATKGKWVISEVADQTQRKFKTEVERLVTMAIQSVFDKPYLFELVVGRFKGAVTYTPIITEGKRVRDLEEDMGSSIVDIISITMRVVLWSMEYPRSIAVFILDEPFRWVGDGEELSLAGQMLKVISDMMGVQFIVITHKSKLADMAETVHAVTNDGIESYVTLTRGDFPIERVH